MIQSLIQIVSTCNTAVAEPAAVNDANSTNRDNNANGIDKPHSVKGTVHHKIIVSAQFWRYGPSL